jgi:uncharacterized membrane protein (UPF0127 family)
VVRVALITAALVAACTKATPPDPPPPVPQPDPTPTRPDNRPRVIVTTPAGEAAVRVEVVATDPLIERGLMYRQHLPPDDGMLFMMGAQDDWRFWMKNTMIPLDILFITRDFTVAGILYDMKPLDPTSKGIGKPSLYVLEVNAGWAKAHGVDAGAKVAFDGIKL